MTALSPDVAARVKRCLQCVDVSVPRLRIARDCYCPAGISREAGGAVLDMGPPHSRAPCLCAGGGPPRVASTEPRARFRGPGDVGPRESLPNDRPTQHMVRCGTDAPLAMSCHRMSARSMPCPVSALSHTPMYMPVGTKGSVKGLTNGQLEEMGYHMILGNTYHLERKPGSRVVEKVGRGETRAAAERRALPTERMQRTGCPPRSWATCTASQGGGGAC